MIHFTKKYSCFARWGPIGIPLHFSIFCFTLRDTESMTDLCLSVLRRDRLDVTAPTANASLFFRGAPQPRINETYHPSPTSPSSYDRFVAVGHRPGGSISSIFIKHVISVLP